MCFVVLNLLLLSGALILWIMNLIVAVVCFFIYIYCLYLLFGFFHLYFSVESLCFPNELLRRKGNLSCFFSSYQCNFTIGQFICQEALQCYLSQMFFSWPTSLVPCKIPLLNTSLLLIWPFSDIFHILLKIPRIILTRPSTSDEDTDQVPPDPDDFEPEELDSGEGHTYLDSLNSAFYPP